MVVEQSDAPMEQDLYNKEDDFIRRILAIYNDFVVPAKIEAQMLPNADTIKTYSVALDSVVSLLELTMRLADKDITELHKGYNKAIADCMKSEKISATPLRAFQHTLGRIIAKKKFFERTYDTDDEIKEALKEDG